MDIKMGKKIIAIEEYINTHFLNASHTPECYEPMVKCMDETLDLKGKIEMVNDSVSSVRQMDITRRTDIDYLLAYLVRRGYVLQKSNEDDNDIPDTVRFYEDANIVQSVWSRYMNGETRRLNHDTFLKIIVALRMPISDVNEYMRMTANNFNSLDKRDMYILSIIANDYFGATDAYEAIGEVNDILNYYSEQELKSGRNPLKQLYDF